MTTEGRDAQGRVPRLRLLKPERPASRPGPGPTPPALLRALDVAVRRRIDGLLAGEHRATTLGQGTELAQVRPYVPGDDVRLMDWNVTARTRTPHVRVHVAERALVTWLVLDVSPSMVFGTATRRKADVAEGAALVVGHIATRRGNRLGVVTFGDRQPRALPPRQGQSGLLPLLTALRREPEEEGTGATSLGEALRRAGHLSRQRSLVVIVSDFRGPRDWRQPLLQIAGRNDVLAVEVRDPREVTLPDVGEMTLVDPETGRQLRVDTRNRTLRERFAQRAAAEREEVASELAAAGVRHVVLTTEGDWLRRLATYLRRPPPPVNYQPGRPVRPRRPGGPTSLRTSLRYCLARFRRGPMTFASPLLLWGLLLIPLALGAYVLAQRRRARYAVRFTNLDLLANLIPRTAGWRRHVPALLYLAALSALLLSLARPRMMVPVPKEQATVVMVLDTSGSMAATDVQPNRMAAAQQAGKSFLDVLPPKFRVAVVSFNSVTQTLLRPTTDRRAAREALDSLRADGGTAMGDGLLRGLQLTELSLPAGAGQPGPAGPARPAGGPAPARSAGDADAGAQPHAPAYAPAYAPARGHPLRPGAPPRRDPPPLGRRQHLRGHPAPPGGAHGPGDGGAGLRHRPGDAGGHGEHPGAPAGRAPGRAHPAPDRGDHGGAVLRRPVGP